MDKITQKDLETLTKTFPKDKLGVKVQSLSKNRDKAMLVLYLQHTDVMNRLEEVDPCWMNEVIEERGGNDYVCVRMRVIIKGVTRENVGDGRDPKAAYSDAIKRCAMMFGVGRYLYDAPTVWVPYNEQEDRFKQFTIEEYEMAAKRLSSASKAASSAKPKVAPKIVPARLEDQVFNDQDVSL